MKVVTGRKIGMIGKVKKGKSFAGLTKYILEKEQAQLLCTNLSGDTPEAFYKQLMATCQLNYRVKSPVSHISISFAWGENPDKQKLEQIVAGVIGGMGFEKNLYFAATHDDCNHFHLHIAASRINIEGECISDWYDKQCLENVLRNLESQFDLTSVPCSWEVDKTAPSTGQKRRMMREKREFEAGVRVKNAEKTAVEKIQDAIASAIKPGISASEFVDRLKVAGIEMSLRVTREGIIQGVSYSVDGVSFRGGKLGRKGKACTLSGLIERGVDYDLKCDTLALLEFARYDSQGGGEICLNSLARKIQNHPQNLSLNHSYCQSDNEGVSELKPNSPQHRKNIQIEMD
jgi:hypothetical protein